MLKQMLWWQKGRASTITDTAASPQDSLLWKQVSSYQTRPVPHTAYVFICSTVTLMLILTATFPTSNTYHHSLLLPTAIKDQTTWPFPAAEPPAQQQSLTQALAVLVTARSPF